MTDSPRHRSQPEPRSSKIKLAQRKQRAINQAFWRLWPSPHGDPWRDRRHDDMMKLDLYMDAQAVDVKDTKRRSFMPLRTPNTKSTVKQNRK